MSYMVLRKPELAASIGLIAAAGLTLVNLRLGVPVQFLTSLWGFVVALLIVMHLTRRWVRKGDGEREPWIATLAEAAWVLVVTLLFFWLTKSGLLV